VQHGDILYLVGPEQPTDELKYSLRSLRYVDHDRVWIAGHCPDWVTGVRHIPVEQTKGKRENTRANLEAALATEGLSDPFQLWCDDFYAVQPIGRLHAMNGGPLLTAIHGARHGYRRALQQAYTHLTQQGIAQPLAYDALHVPQWFHKTPLAHTLGTGIGMYQTVYGNTHRDHPGQQVPNAKRAQGHQDRAWISTNSTTWHSPIGQWVRDAHPDPGPYEATT